MTGVDFVVDEEGEKKAVLIISDGTECEAEHV